MQKWDGKPQKTLVYSFEDIRNVPHISKHLLSVSLKKTIKCALLQCFSSALGLIVLRHEKNGFLRM